MPLFENSLDVQPAICKAPRQSNTDFTRYPLCKLSDLLEELRAKHKTTIRYLIDTEYNLWLAREGAPGGKVPSHAQMTGSNSTGTSCIAAGNIKFSKENNTIIKINNKSGDFQPAFDSIKWLLAIIQANIGADIFASSIEFERFITQSSAIGETLTRAKEDVLSEIEMLFSPEKMDELKNQPTAISELQFRTAISSKRPRTSEVQPGRGKLLTQFFSSPGSSSDPCSSTSTFTEYQPIPFNLPEPGLF